MTEQILARRAGDEDAFRELTDPFRRELQLHVYRIVGSVQDAEDLLQETLLAAWRGLERFEGRASVRAWLYRIATNRSLDCLRASRRRPEGLQRMTEMPEPTAGPSRSGSSPTPTLLFEGIPDDAPGPEARYETRRRSRWRSSSAFSTCRRSSARCSCCATCSASAPARSPRMLDTTAPSANSLLRRARAAFESRLPAAGRERAPLPNSKLERDVVGSFADVVERSSTIRRQRKTRGEACSPTAIESDESDEDQGFMGGSQDSCFPAADPVVVKRLCVQQARSCFAPPISESCCARTAGQLRKAMTLAPCASGSQRRR